MRRGAWLAAALLAGLLWQIGPAAAAVQITRVTAPAASKPGWWKTTACR